MLLPTSFLTVFQSPQFAMPGEILDRPNPPPGKSQLPDSILEYHINLHPTDVLTEEELQAITKFRRTADYIAAAMIFLKDNVLLEREIRSEDIKPRLLGHWGTCPGLVLTYAHLNILIKKENQKMIFVVGPGMSHSRSTCVQSQTPNRTWGTCHSGHSLDRGLPREVLPPVRPRQGRAHKLDRRILYPKRFPLPHQRRGSGINTRRWRTWIRPCCRFRCRHG